MTLKDDEEVDTGTGVVSQRLRPIVARASTTVGWAELWDLRYAYEKQEADCAENAQNYAPDLETASLLALFAHLSQSLREGTSEERPVTRVRLSG